MIKDIFTVLLALFAYYLIYIILANSFQSSAFLWLTPLLIGFLFAALRVIKTTAVQYFTILLLSISLFFYCVEIYLKISESSVQTFHPSKYINFKSELGYQAREGEFQSRKINKKTVEVIYDVTYNINKDGYRITPNIDENGSAILFFGCSFTFGEGLENNQTLPAQFSSLTSQKFNVINFGFSGYGPHQMLRSLELSKPDKYIKKDVKAVFFQLIDSHVYRVSGKVSWGMQSPFYQFNQADELFYDGAFHSKFSAIPIIKRTLIYYNFYSRIFGTDKMDLKRLIAILRKSQNLVNTKYHAPFYVILWLGETYPYMNEMREELDKEFNVIWVPDLLILNPGEDWSKKYSIVNDGHPNAYSYNLIAQHLAKCCVK